MLLKAIWSILAKGFQLLITAIPGFPPSQAQTDTPSGFCRPSSDPSPRRKIWWGGGSRGNHT